MKYAIAGAVILLSVNLPCAAQSTLETKALQYPAAPTLQCANLPSDIDDNIQARYNISASQTDIEVGRRDIRLIKNRERVIYQESPMTFEAWNRDGEYVRYFPKELRSITYRVSDLRSLNISYDLDQLFHLISPKLMLKLQRSNSIAHSCFSLSQYQGMHDGQMIELKWIESLALPYELTIAQGEQQITYRLISANKLNDDEFNNITTGYRDLDFADVGDSESDPFIAKMITQGFIQHGNSGFYDSDGHRLPQGHGSHTH